MYCDKYLHFLICHLILQMRKLQVHKSENFVCLVLLLYPLHVEQCLGHSSCSKNICWLDR